MTCQESGFLPQEYITQSAQETFELAYRIGEELKGGEVFLLSGELGAGKTVFAKGLAAGLEIDPAEVNSPTFTLINAHSGRLRLFHLDLYRLSEGSDTMMELGLNELLDEPDVVMVIEWAERLGSRVAAGARRVEIELSAGGLDERRIRIEN
jgi:tRNA threonylcarbamoyladenosine biosynthesis protein TsaE